ncbi:hypothetical protein HAX54_046589, partial [Datura stramonium]|nr:hypothetical protein [Datura stramonium]
MPLRLCEYPKSKIYSGYMSSSKVDIDLQGMMASFDAGRACAYLRVVLNMFEIYYGCWEAVLRR